MGGTKQIDGTRRWDKKKSENIAGEKGRGTESTGNL
jgi:hypothetical protein